MYDINCSTTCYYSKTDRLIFKHAIDRTILARDEMGVTPYGRTRSVSTFQPKVKRTSKLTNTTYMF